MPYFQEPFPWSLPILAAIVSDGVTRSPSPTFLVAHSNDQTSGKVHSMMMNAMTAAVDEMAATND